MSGLRVVQTGETRTRVTRKPTFPIFGKVKPFGLYPVMCTPVLPAETLQEFEMKARHISMPIRNPLVGAWLEQWLVYVKLTDIDHALAQMFISNDHPTTGFTASASSDRYFTRAGQIDYIRMATETVWKSYFADDGEVMQTIDGVPLIRRGNVDWTQNLMFTPDDLVVDDLPSNPEGQLTGIQIMALAGMSEITYEKYLQQYGVSQAATASMEHKPEILRYSRSWVTPVNQIDPATGAPSSAWAWSGTLKNEKPKRFEEPGFLVLLQAVRPKMFSDALRYSVCGNLWGFADFFPAYNLTDPAAGIKEIMSDDPAFLDAFGPDAESAESILYDHRDILNHGEQFINSYGDNPYHVPLITTQRVTSGDNAHQLMRGLYPSLTDVNNLFATSALETPVESGRCVYYEGICEATIRGHVRDTTL